MAAASDGCQVHLGTLHAVEAVSCVCSASRSVGVEKGSIIVPEGDQCFLSGEAVVHQVFHVRIDGEACGMVLRHVHCKDVRGGAARGVEGAVDQVTVQVRGYLEPSLRFIRDGILVCDAQNHASMGAFLLHGAAAHVFRMARQEGSEARASAVVVHRLRELAFREHDHIRGVIFQGGGNEVKVAGQTHGVEEPEGDGAGLWGRSMSVTASLLRRRGRGASGAGFGASCRWRKRKGHSLGCGDRARCRGGRLLVWGPCLV